MACARGSEAAWEASVLQLGCVLNDGSPDAQKPVQDASHTVQRTTGHFGFERCPPTGAQNQAPKGPARRAEGGSGLPSVPNRSSPPTSGSPASAAAQTPAAPMDDITNNEGKEDQPAEKYKYEVPEPMESCLRSMETTHRTILMLRCKVVVVGDATVGKSALISMFHSGGASYPKQYVMTSWVDFRVKQVDIPDTSTAVELYLFDCAGDPVLTQRLH